MIGLWYNEMYNRSSSHEGRKAHRGPFRLFRKGGDAYGYGACTCTNDFIWCTGCIHHVRKERQKITPHVVSKSQ